jgi:hypothetical protein
VHLHGTHVSFYWATFPYHYIDTVRNVSTAKLAPDTSIQIHHSKPCDLIVPKERAQAIRDLVALVRFVMAGGGKVGYFHKTSKVLGQTQAEAGTEPRASVPPRAPVPPQESEEERRRTDEEPDNSDHGPAPIFDPDAAKLLSTRDLDNECGNYGWENWVDSGDEEEMKEAGEKEMAI